MSSPFSHSHIMQGDRAQLDALYTSATAPAPPERLRKNTNEKMFALLFEQQPLDAALASLLAQLKTAFVANTNQYADFYCDPLHPLRKFFHFLSKDAATWYPRDAKPNQLFLEKLTALTQNTLDWQAQPGNLLLTQNLQAALDDLREWTNAEDKRAALLESRLCEAELNSFKLIDAECKVLMLINSALAHHYFPSDLIAGVSATLKSELQHCAITDNTTSPLWKIWASILPPLGRLFLPEETPESDQELYKQAPLILQQLERSLTLNPSSPEDYRRFVDALSASLMFAIQKQSQACEIFKPLAYPEGYIDTDTRIVGAVLQQSDNIQQGDWILFTGENNQVIRCKLALRNTASGQLLFVDRTGRKVMVKNMKDFSLCLTTGIAKPLDFIEQDALIEKHLQGLIELSKKNQAVLQQQAQAESTKKMTAQEEQKRAEEQAQQLIAEQKQQEKLAQQQAAAQKALQEAKLFAEQKAQREKEQKIAQQQEQQLAQQELLQQQLEAHAAQERQLAAQASTELLKLQFAQQQVQTLNVGAWIEIINDDQSKQRCKLAVIIASAGKYIFVDNLGRKVAEYKREQLVDDYINNKISLLNNGDKFEDQLAKVIRGLRKDIS